MTFDAKNDVRASLRSFHRAPHRHGAGRLTQRVDRGPSFGFRVRFNDEPLSAAACVPGLARAKRQGQLLGRPRVEVSADALASVAGLSSRQAAVKLGVSATTVRRLRQ